jgi:uncharacterized membrane protein
LTKTFNQRRRRRQYQKEDSLYSDNKLDKQDIEKLDEMKYKTKIAYAKGKITEQQYEDLKKEISISYQEVYKGIIVSLKEPSTDGDSVQLDEFRDDISYAYSKGKIAEQHYNNLKNEISLIYEEIYNRRIISLDGKFDYSTSNNVFQLLNGIKDDITDAYSKGKITEQHYNSLNNKISGYKNNYQAINKLSSSFQNLTSTSTKNDGNQ